MIDTAKQRITALEKKIGPDAKSPLFAQLAYYYLDTKRAQDALRTCDAGLAHFPFYTTGHFIKGKALLMLNMRAEARREFEFVLDFLPSNATVMALLSQMPPGEDETIAVAEAPQKEVVQQEPPATPRYDYAEPQVPQTPASPEPNYGFGGSEQVAPALQPQQEPSFESIAAKSTFFDAITQESAPEVADTSFSSGFETPSVVAPVEPEPTAFSGFGFQPSEPPSFGVQAPPSIEQPSGFDFAMPTPEINFQSPSVPSEEESFDQYSQRRRNELSGENTISLDDYFNNTGAVLSPGSVDLQFPAFESPIETPSSEPNKIEELANRLQSAGKITPVIDFTQKESPTPVINFAQKETSTASEQDTPAGMGFVTPTLAEIYAKQGWYDDAIKAYKTLARNKPAEKERYEKRIAELEALKSQSSS
jgi:tetratricopeptide (TPR) repeat protein